MANPFRLRAYNRVVPLPGLIMIHPRLASLLTRPTAPVLIVFALLLVSCSPSGFETPRPSLTNDGLNSVYPDTEPAMSEDGRLIVFTSARNGNQAIYLYDTLERRLIDLPGLNANEVAYSSPDISGDGRYLVYLSNELGKAEVFLYDRQTREVRNISSRLAGDVRHPTISGDGRYIAFENNGTGQWQIELFDRGPDVNATNPDPAPASGSR